MHQVQRAEFWAEIAQDHLTSIRDAERREAIEALTGRMRSLQTEVNRLYRRYQEIEADIARHQKTQQVLNGIQVLTSIIEAGIQAGQISSAETGQNVISEGQPATDVPAMVEYTERILEYENGAAREIWRELRIQYNDLRSLDRSIRGLYQEESVPIPNTAPSPLDLPR